MARCACALHLDQLFMFKIFNKNSYFHFSRYVPAYANLCCPSCPIIKCEKWLFMQFFGAPDFEFENAFPLQTYFTGDYSCTKPVFCLVHPGPSKVCFDMISILGDIYPREQEKCRWKESACQKSGWKKEMQRTHLEMLLPSVSSFTECNQCEYANCTVEKSQKINAEKISWDVAS